MRSKFLLLSLLGVILCGCGDQNPPTPPQPVPATGKPMTEEEIGRPDLAPPEKKDCAILGFLCK